jgi:2-oxoglutarate ferredoxin oxidoreductase subunit alpha
VAKTKIKHVDHVVIRFAGDSGDGMQLTGSRFTESTAIFGNDLSTLPDYPAEIRAPAGSLAGVSVFQLHFSSKDIHTPGDQPDVLVAMNPAALKGHLADLEPHGIIIANSNAFSDKNLHLAGYKSNPLEDGSLESEFEVHAIRMTSLVTKACENIDLSLKDVERTKNMFALGLLFWMYNRNTDTTVEWLQKKFKNKPSLVEANIRALNAGYNYGNTTEMFTVRYTVEKATLPPGKYRNINGNYAISLGLLAASEKSGLPLFFGGYPITPATEILHFLASYRATSGPGMALKTEAMGLAIMAELPLVIVNVQRGGPSTGLPTKTEQSDLFQAVMGRNADAPIPVIAPSTPGDCFYAAFEASQIAIKYMTPVIVLSDGYLANGSEPWPIPKMEDLPKIDVKFETEYNRDEKYLPYKRNKQTLARPWAIPGTPNLEHRLGGLEKEDVTGDVNYEADNHHLMTTLRAQKIANVANDYPPTKVFGKDNGDMLILTWGSTFGPGRVAAERLHKENIKASHVHLRYMNPLPIDLDGILKKFKHILIPEINMGQLRTIIRAKYLVEAEGLNVVRGRPIRASVIVSRVKKTLGI